MVERYLYVSSLTIYRNICSVDNVNHLLDEGFKWLGWLVGGLEPLVRANADTSEAQEGEVDEHLFKKEVGGQAVLGRQRR